MVNYHAFDYQKALKHFGDENSAHEMTKAFYTDHFNKMIEDLHHSMMTMDFTQIRAYLHIIRGTFGYISSDKVMQLAVSMSDAAHELSSEKIIARYIKFLHEAKVLKREVADYLGEPVNTRDLEAFEQETKRNFGGSSKVVDIGETEGANKHDACCAGCNIF